MVAARRVAIAVVAVVVLAVAVDRLVLAVWRFRVTRLYSRLTEEAKLDRQLRIQHWQAGEWWVLNVAPPEPGDHPRYPVALTELTLRGLNPVPSQITVDGFGGLHLKFLPPSLVWSARLFGRQHPGMDARIVDGLADEMYTVSVLWYSGGKEPSALSHPRVELSHGLPLF